jgi:O-antigen/teichoic acid export membrane protein
MIVGLSCSWVRRRADCLGSHAGSSRSVVSTEAEREDVGRLSAARSSLRRAGAKGRDVGSAMLFEIVQLVSMAIIFPIVTQSFGPASYGEYTTLYVIAGVAITWTSASAGAAIVQLSLQHRRTASSLLAAGRRQVAWSSVPSAVIGCALAVVLFGPDILVPALLVFGGDLLIGGIANVQAALVYAVRGVAQSARIRMITPAVKALGVLGLAMIDRVTIVTVVLANSVAAAVMLAVSFYVVRRAQPEADRGEVEDATPREVLRYTGLYATTISANVVQDGGENVVLAAVRPISEVGEYQAAYRLVELALMPLRAVNTASTRWFLLPEHGRSVQVRRSWRLSVPVALYGLACIGVFSVMGPLVTLVIGDEFELAVTIMAWLSGFPLVRSLADIPALGLMGLDRNKPRMWLGLSGAAFAITCYLILVPMWGWKGAVVGTYLSEIATLVGGWVVLLFYQRRHDASFESN